MTSILERKLLLVTGKGGTGKTTVAASLARHAADTGRRVLLCEIDAVGDLARALDVDQAGFEPVEVERNLHLMAMDTQAALQEYLKLNLKLPLAIRGGPFARAFDFVATAAPGVREVLTTGKLCWEVKRERWDVVVVDAPATGHIVSQLTSPVAIGGLIDVGPLSGQTSWMKELLSDPTRTGAVVVTTPDEIPVSETVTLVDRLATESRTPLATVIVNRSLPELFTKGDEAVFDTLVGESLTAVPGDVDGVLEVARLGRELRRIQTGHLSTLAKAVGQTVPLIFIPQNFDTLDPVAIVNQMQAGLAAELEV